MIWQWSSLDTWYLQGYIHEKTNETFSLGTFKKWPTDIRITQLVATHLS